MTDNNLVYKVQAKRGWLYLFRDEKAEYKDKYVVVVSNNNRQTDKLVSILVLGDSNAGSDVVPVKVPGIGTMYAHTGMVTYIGRDKLTTEISQISKKTMDTIDTYLISQYGLIPAVKLAEYNLYKGLYNELLDRFVPNDNNIDN